MEKIRVPLVHDAYSLELKISSNNVQNSSTPQLPSDLFISCSDPEQQPGALVSVPAQTVAKFLVAKSFQAYQIHTTGEVVGEDKAQSERAGIQFIPYLESEKEYHGPTLIVFTDCSGGRVFNVINTCGGFDLQDISIESYVEIKATSMDLIPTFVFQILKKCKSQPGEGYCLYVPSDDAMQQRASVSEAKKLISYAENPRFDYIVDMPPAIPASDPTHIHGLMSPAAPKSASILSGGYCFIKMVGTSIAGACANFTHSVSGWLVRRCSRKAHYPPEAERLLFQESLATKMLPPTVTAAAALAVNYLPDDGKAATLGPLVPLLFNWVGSGLLCLSIGEVLQTKVPEIAVLAMLGSKVLWYAALFAAIINHMGDAWVTWLVYPATAAMVISHFPMLYEILTKGVRESEAGLVV